MTIELANRLAACRKAQGMTQEELAEKIGVSRQAVSKWERGEASPDTDNIIALANIYGMKLDEMIYGESTPPVKDENDRQTDEKENATVAIDGDCVTVYENGKSRTFSKQKLEKSRIFERKLSKIFPAYVLAVVIAYLLLGFLLPGARGWSDWWFLFITIPVVLSVVEVYKTRSVASFNYPCLVTAFYCAVGMMANVWHPTWICFITIPVFYIMASAFPDNKNAYAKAKAAIEPQAAQNEDEEEDEDEDKDEDDRKKIRNNEENGG